MASSIESMSAAVEALLRRDRAVVAAALAVVNRTRLRLGIVETKTEVGPRGLPVILARLVMSDATESTEPGAVRIG